MRRQRARVRPAVGAAALVRPVAVGLALSRACGRPCCTAARRACTRGIPATHVSCQTGKRGKRLHHEASHVKHQPGTYRCKAPAWATQGRQGYDRKCKSMIGPDLIRSFVFLCLSGAEPYLCGRRMQGWRRRLQGVICAHGWRCASRRSAAGDVIVRV